MYFSVIAISRDDKYDQISGVTTCQLRICLCISIYATIRKLWAKLLNGCPYHASVIFGFDARARSARVDICYKHNAIRVVRRFLLFHTFGNIISRTRGRVIWEAVPEFRIMLYGKVKYRHSVK